MRLISALLIGVFAVALADAGSAGERTQGWSRPGGGYGGGNYGGGSRSWGGSGLSVTIPLTVIPHINRRSCPKGTAGTWPDCVAVTPPKKCPKGTTGKWPDCREFAKPSDKPCPEGQVRKGKKCVEVTKDDSGATKPPSTAKVKKQDAIPPAIAALTANKPHQPREILILVDATKAGEIAGRLARQHNLAADPRLVVPLLDRAIVRLRFTGNRSLESLLAALSTDPDVELVQPNYDYRVSKDKTAAQAAPQYAGEKIRLDEAHDVARGQGVIVAVIDTAIDAAHPELLGAIAGNFDAVGKGPAKAESHGTGIAGILVARSRLTGVAPEAKLLSVRAFSGGGAKPAQSTTFQLLKAIDWAFASGARVMNMSFAGPIDPLLERIIKAAAEKGAVFIAAAGNNGPKAAPVYPAAYPDVIAVTATDEADKLYGKANRGDYIFIAAPGVDILAPAPKGRYELSSGTSMAAAHVSGVVALLLENDGKLTSVQIREILSATARKPGGSLGKDAVGAGILDAASALGDRQPEAADEAAVPIGASVSDDR
jgi:subtilisin family serine protease